MLMLLLGKGIYGQLPALPAPPPHTHTEDTGVSFGQGEVFFVSL